MEPISGSLFVDPKRFQQIIWNRLSNAIKFTPPAGCVQVHLANVNHHIEISITDSGEGISPNFLPHVFDRFRQADASTTRKHGGLGLGPAISKQLAELHGGTISVRSEGFRSGATFMARFPLSSAFRKATHLDRPHPDHSPHHHPPSLPSLKGLRILAVDDELDAREVVYYMLTGCKAEVITVPSAADALVQLAKWLPHVIVSDIGMPDVDGYQFLRQVRALEENEAAHIPAIALTAFARPEDRERALSIGYAAYITKPVNLLKLITAIKHTAAEASHSM